RISTSRFFLQTRQTVTLPSVIRTPFLRLVLPTRPRQPSRLARRRRLTGRVLPATQSKRARRRPGYKNEHYKKQQKVGPPTRYHADRAIRRHRRYPCPCVRAL